MYKFYETVIYLTLLEYFKKKIEKRDARETVRLKGKGIWTHQFQNEITKFLLRIPRRFACVHLHLFAITKFSETRVLLCTDSPSFYYFIILTLFRLFLKEISRGS